jgi:hypothetical protein
MTVIPVSRMLFELGPPAAAVDTQAEKSAAELRCKSCRTEDEIRAEVHEAHARGVAEGWECGRTEGIRTEEQIRSSLADEQDARFAELANEAKSRIEAGLECLRTETSKDVAQALAAFFQVKIELEAVEAMSNELCRIFSEKAPARVTIRGPRDWIDRLAALPQIAGGAGGVDLQVSDKIDVAITIDSTTLETTVGEWLSGLRCAR